MFAHGGVIDEYPTAALGMVSRTDLEPRFFKYRTAFTASLDVKTAFDVVKSAVVSRILTLTWIHGHVVAALLAEMKDVRGSACFENCKTELRYSK